MVIPTVHLNGTSSQALMDGYCEVHSAIETAIETMAKHGPNARDYYVKDDAFAVARNEHCKRLATLRTIKEEIGAILEGISSQGGA